MRLETLPTRLVRMRGGNGDAVIINESDFDAALHEPVTAAEAAVPAAPPADVPPVVDESTHGQTIADVKAAIAATTNADKLRAMRTGEMFHPRYTGGRPGVLGAIDARLAALNV